MAPKTTYIKFTLLYANIKAVKAPIIAVLEFPVEVINPGKIRALNTAIGIKLKNDLIYVGNFKPGSITIGNILGKNCHAYNH